MTDTSVGVADSVAPAFEQPQQADYFGFQATERYIFPDGLTFVEFQVMNEGQKLKFQKATGRDIVLQRSGDARLRMDPGAERHELIKACVTNWNLARNGQLIPFNPRSLNDFLELADPKIIEKIENAIRRANPWLLGEVSAADIKEQIKELEEMLVVAEEREAGEASSASK
jgi:hypothetical protein